MGKLRWKWPENHEMFQIFKPIPIGAGLGVAQANLVFGTHKKGVEAEKQLYRLVGIEGEIYGHYLAVDYQGRPKLIN